MRHWHKGVLAGAIIALAGTLAAVSSVGDYLEKHAGLSWLFAMRGVAASPDKVAVIAINEQVSRRLGLPAMPRDWPRSTHARLIEELTRRGVSQIVFDLDFRNPKDPAEDQRLVDAVEKSGRVVLFQALNGKRQPVLDATGKAAGTIWMEELLDPFPELADAARALGSFPLPKVQVTVFQFWTFKSSVSDSPTLPSVALQLALDPGVDRLTALLSRAGVLPQSKLDPIQTDASPADALQARMRHLRGLLRDNPVAVEQLRRLDDGPGDQRSDSLAQSLDPLIELYTGGDNRFLNFYGPPGTILNLPYDAVINGVIAPSGQALPDLTDAVVFVGYSDLFDPGQPDRFYTVFSTDGVDLSGVEIIATAFANMRDRATLRPLDGLQNVLLVLLLGLSWTLVIFLLQLRFGLPVMLGLALGYVWLAQDLFDAQSIWLPLATPLLIQLPMAILAGVVGHYLLQRQRQEQATRMVSYYLPEHAIQELSGNLDPGALNKVVYGVCFATDMSGFTSISQQMEPDELAAFMNAYFDTLAKSLHRHQVDVTEFHADTIMCAWTSEGADSLERQHAPRAALSLLDAVVEFNAGRENIDLRLRVGMDEGRFFLGHTGGGGRMGYSILGDCANTAARLESLNKHLGTHILASAPVVAQTRDLLVRDLGRFMLVGKEEAVSVMEVMGVREHATADQLRLQKRFSVALEHFKARQWTAALDVLIQLLEEFPGDGPARFYLERVQTYIQFPPQGDDPSIIKMESK